MNEELDNLTPLELYALQNDAKKALEDASRETLEEEARYDSAHGEERTDAWGDLKYAREVEERARERFEEVSNKYDNSIRM